MSDDDYMPEVILHLPQGAVRDIMELVPTGPSTNLIFLVLGTLGWKFLTAKPISGPVRVVCRRMPHILNFKCAFLIALAVETKSRIPIERNVRMTSQPSRTS